MPRTTITMGLGMVLLAGAVIGTIVAGTGSVILGIFTDSLTRGVTRGRRQVIFAAAAFPIACLVWAAFLFLFQALVNQAGQRDPGVGDWWNCPLPNGYAIAMIDVTDHGWVYNPKTQSDGTIGEREDAVGDVRALQVAGRYIFGSYGGRPLGAPWEESNKVDYFLLDTQMGKRTTFQNFDVMRYAASRLDIRLKLEPIDSVYYRYRFTWFDIAVGAFLFIPPLVYLWLLARQVLKLRKARSVGQASA